MLISLITFTPFCVILSIFHLLPSQDWVFFERRDVLYLSNHNECTFIHSFTAFTENLLCARNYISTWSLGKSKKKKIISYGAVYRKHSQNISRGMHPQGTIILTSIYWLSKCLISRKAMIKMHFKQAPKTGIRRPST